jgi:hypothetical protein
MRLPKHNPAVLCQAVAEGALLLHTKREVYFGLNVVGAQIWELLPPKCSELAELCAELERRYPNAEPEGLRSDVTELLDALAAQELLLASTSE